MVAAETAAETVAAPAGWERHAGGGDDNRSGGDGAGGEGDGKSGGVVGCGSGDIGGVEGCGGESSGRVHNGMESRLRARPNSCARLACAPGQPRCAAVLRVCAAGVHRGALTPQHKLRRCGAVGGAAESVTAHLCTPQT